MVDLNRAVEVKRSKLDKRRDIALLHEIARPHLSMGVPLQNFLNGLELNSIETVKAHLNEFFHKKKKAPYTRGRFSSYPIDRKR
ncbi:hypothetical protein LAZ67_17000662 [Cordylochernes scorpioides]|uniref:Uncharacterized protein n=1 Tax=Cordylochernes scorpioides TaxID=51811 RepID=A0ABY6LFN4_9ARAC|nr:hypothetical protein LAZ67_17000662 [Cordylochernes scorpioides]